MSKVRGPEKRVRMTIEVSASFLRLLRANVTLDGGIVTDRALDPPGVLARIVLVEGMGATEPEVDLAVPPEWRADIEAIHAERKVYQVEPGKAPVLTSKPPSGKARR